MTTHPTSRWKALMPGLCLAIMAPIFAEVLPGATRFSSLFVFPIEVAVWGGGAVMARALVRSRRLGWWSLLLLGLALAIAEEFLIQQTSTAPMVIRLKGETWARAFDVNYVYLIWALAYESVWVVLMPTLATELIFHERKHEPWLSRGGAIAMALLFTVGCVFAWFTWTQIARTKVFHQAPFTLPLHLALLAAAAIVLLVFAALKIAPAWRQRAVAPPRPWLLGLLCGLWAVFWFGLVVLAFGLVPTFPPALAVGSALAILALIVAIVPRWASAPGWNVAHQYALIAGGLCGSMAVSFVAFEGADPKDLWFKVIANFAALAFLAWLSRVRARILRTSTAGAGAAA